MNDGELLAKLREHAPHEWTADELRLLRERLPQSPELQEALREELRLDQGLSETLGRFEVSLDRIYAAAPAGRGAGPWTWTLACLLIAGLGVGLWQLSRPKEIARVEPPPAATTEDSAAAATAPAPTAADSGAAWLAQLPRRPESTANAAAATTSAPEGVGTAVPGAQVAAAPLPDSVKLRPSPSLIEDFQADGKQAGIDLGTFKNWLAPVPKEPAHFFEHHSRPAFDGVLRWKFAWPEGATLRMGLFEPDRLRFHCWDGPNGASFTYCRHPHPNWGGFLSVRKEGAVKPQDMYLVASDEDRFHRSGRGTLELRWENGCVLLSRGDVRLVSIPLPRQPTELVFEGRTGFRGLEWIVAQPLPPETFPPRRIVLRSDRPGDLEWLPRLSGKAAFAATPDGAAELSAPQRLDKQVVAFTALPQGGPFEAAFLVEDPQPGTGVCLADRDGKPLHRLGFFRESQSGKTVFGLLRNDEVRHESWHDPYHQPFPGAGPRQWVKLTLGAGSLQLRTSADGERWSQALEPLRDVQSPAVAAVGIFIQQNFDKPRRIRLRHLTVREFSPLVDLVPAELLARAPVYSLFGDLGTWEQTVSAARPAEVDPAAWRTACAIRTLADRPASRLGRLMLAGLAEDAARSDRPWSEKLHVLDAAAELADAWEANDAAGPLARYRLAAEQAAAAGDPQPWTKLYGALVRTPLWTAGQVDPLPEDLLRTELLGQVNAGRWEPLREACRQATFLARMGYPWQEYDPGKRSILQWLQWGQAVAERALPRVAGEEIVPLALSWRHPLEEQVSKEGYNVLAEFSAALQGNSLKDACLIITSSSPTSTLGLVPDAKDNRLWVSLPGAVLMAMREKPALQATMEREFGPLGLLRVREAMTRGDAVAVEAAVVQFFGTQAAAEAHLWLGDRALAEGEFAVAEQQFQQARPAAPPSMQAALAARLRLAAAFTGRDEGSPVTGGVALGTSEFSAGEFERLVQEVRSAHRGRTGNAVAAVEPPQALRNGAAPAPRKYRTDLVERWDGKLGRDQDRAYLRGWDAPASQYAHLAVGDELILHNRFHTISFHAKDGKRRWSTGLNNGEGYAHKWLLTPMRPVVAGDRIFLRRLTERGPELAALNRANGDVLWRRQPGHHVASDPIVTQDAVVALCFQAVGQEQFHLELVRFDPRTGDILSQRRLLVFRNVWDDQPPCQATLAGDRLVVAVGGSVLCCDLLGRPQWLRRETWIPYLGDESLLEGLHEPPLVEGNRVYVTQPHVKTVACLDLIGGRRIWQRSIPDLRGIVGLRSDRLVLETAAGYEAVGRRDGASLWRISTPDRAAFVGCGAEGDLCRVDRLALQNRAPSRLQFVWTDVETGRERARASLDGPTDDNAKLGPFFAAGERRLALIGSGDKNPRRDLFALLPAGEAAAAETAPPLLLGYDDYVLRARSPRIAYALPGWHLLDSSPDQEVEFKPEWYGQKNVLVTGAAVGQSAWLDRTVDVAPGTRLAYEVQARSGAPWEFVVKADRETLLRRPVEAEKDGGLVRGEIDLAKFVGRRIVLTAEQKMTKQSGTGGWKRLELLLPEPPRAE